MGNIKPRNLVQLEHIKQGRKAGRHEKPYKTKRKREKEKLKKLKEEY